jgi:hypothetical protein
MAAEDPLEAVQRPVIHELAGDDVGQQTGARQPPLDRPGEPRGDHHVRGAGPAQASLGRTCSTATRLAGMYSSGSRISSPILDLGTTLGYWAEAGDPPPLQQAAFGPSTPPGSLTRRELAGRYAEQAGRGLDDAEVLYAYALGLFKIAEIIRQIYARFLRGHTRDERFVHLDQTVAALAEQAGRAIAAGRV